MLLGDPRRRGCSSTGRISRRCGQARGGGATYAVGSAGGEDSGVRGVGSSDSRSGEDSRNGCDVWDGGDSDSGGGGYGWSGRERAGATDKQEDKRTGFRHGKTGTDSLSCFRVAVTLT